MTEDSLTYSALTRLLALNNQVHDLESQLQRESFPPVFNEYHTAGEGAPSNRIAATQEEIDRRVRASLITCWLGTCGEPEL